eukprot:GHVR01134308.1.p1 GENE.GHVR01134308.1~~GHVR01134308.1.p1  ORF type:complete len:355 (+),score=83.54 GHVR01134308.1:31-1065(+)
MAKHILCTGGTGYVGSHTVVQLLDEGYKVSILDNLCNSSSKVVQRINKITGKSVEFYNEDLLNIESVSKIFKDNDFDGVIHFAALKKVGESVAEPLKYYDNNISGTINLLKVMSLSKCRVLVFSSSATVYEPCEVAVTESSKLGPSNPYGQTKLMMEQILKDLYVSDSTWSISLLRYFNPVGAHPSALIGESPDHPANVLPYIQQVAVGRLPHVNVFGTDWDTLDGTGVRDYVHVMDLAKGHLCAMKRLEETGDKGCCITHNLGTGSGYSVMELIKAFEKSSGVTIPYKPTDRRPGDLATVIADPSLAKKELGWTATHTIDDSCSSAWAWQRDNPYGFEENESA